MQEFKNKKIVNCSMTKELAADEIKAYKKERKYLIDRGSFFVSTLAIEASCAYFIFAVELHFLLKIAFGGLAIIYLWGIIRDVYNEIRVRTSAVKVYYTEGIFIALQKGLKISCVVEYNEDGNSRKKVIEEPVFLGEKVEIGDNIKIIVEPYYTYIVKC